MITVDNTGAFLTSDTGRFAMSETVRHEKLVDHIVMHPVQSYVIAFFGLPVDVKFGVTAEQAKRPPTFMGIKVFEDEHFPMDRIEMRNVDGETILVIKNLAVPRPDGNQ